MVVKPTPGLPTDAADPRTHVGVYLDVAGLKSIKAKLAGMKPSCSITLVFHRWRPLVRMAKRSLARLLPTMQPS